MTRPTVPFSVVTDISQKRRERAGFEKLTVLETPAVDLNDEVDAIGRELAAISTRLAFLAGAVDNDSLAGAVLGLIGNNAEEIRTQLRPLREALRDMDGAA